MENFQYSIVYSTFSETTTQNLKAFLTHYYFKFITAAFDYTSFLEMCFQL